MKSNNLVPRMYQSFVGTVLLAVIAIASFAGAALVLLIIGAPIGVVVIAPFFIAPLVTWWIERRAYDSTCRDLARMIDEENPPS